MVIPEGVRSRGWENLRMGMPSMVETPSYASLTRQTRVVFAKKTMGYF